MHQNVKSREYISVKYWGTCIFIETLMFYLKMITVIKNTMLISHIFAVFFSKILKKQLSVWMMLLIQRIQIHKWTQTKIKF